MRKAVGLRFLHLLILWIKLPIMSKLLYAESYVLLAVARILLRMVKFRTIAGLLGKSIRETDFLDSAIDPYKVWQISKAVRIMGRHTLWESNCLVQACTAMLMLKRRKLLCTIYFGVAKNPEGKIIAHAWVRSGTIFVTGGDGSRKFKITCIIS